jgi:hypothetical protein
VLLRDSLAGIERLPQVLDKVFCLHIANDLIAMTLPPILTKENNRSSFAVTSACSQTVFDNSACTLPSVNV